MSSTSSLEIESFNFHFKQLESPKNSEQAHANQSSTAKGRKWSCQSCDVKSTLQKRQGPNGRNTLCNTCGLAWSRFVHNKASNHLKCLNCNAIPAIQIPKGSKNFVCQVCFRIRIENNSAPLDANSHKISLAFIVENEAK